MSHRDLTVKFLAFADTELHIDDVGHLDVGDSNRFHDLGAYVSGGSAELVDHYSDEPTYCGPVPALRDRSIADAWPTHHGV